jgi:hypothetical protein
MEKRIALRLKLRKVEGSIVHHNAILARASKGKLVEGYVLCIKQACWHCWVDKDGERMDVYSQMPGAIPFEYSETIPEGYEEMIHENIDENKRAFKLYQENPKQFWKDAPKKVREFKYGQVDR